MGNKSKPTLVLDALLSRSSLHIIPNAGHVPISGQLKEYIQLLKQHLQSPESLLSQQRPVIADEARSEVVRENRQDEIYSGRIRRLVLKNCLDVLVRNAEGESDILMSLAPVQSPDLPDRVLHGLQPRLSTLIQ